ncbi:MAG: LPS export ABC transporter permease LptG [Hyphomicrobiaceae bacterium]
MRLRSILWRYLFVRFTGTILVAFFACFALIYLVDFIEILRQSARVDDVSFATLAYVTFLRMPAFAELTLPFAALVGTVTAFLRLSRSSELTIMRASGMSVWQFLVPGIVVALIIGGLSIAVYNPVAAAASAKSEALRAKLFKRNTSLLQGTRGAWLRQNSQDGPSVIFANNTANRGIELANLFILQYDNANRFLERIEAASATLKDGYWNLSDVLVVRPGRSPEKYGNYHVATNLTREQVSDAFGSLFTVSFWDLPRHIQLAEKAGLSAVQYRVQLELLMSRPFMLAAMVLLGATVSLRAFRFGGIQTMVVTGLIAGLGIFILAEISRQFGIAGLASATVAAWVPVVVACLLPLTALLHQEDG